MNPLSEALRKRQEAERLRGRGLQFQGLADAAGPTTLGGGQTAGMRGVAQEKAENVNWGSIIQRGVGSYQAAKDTKKADELDEQYQALSQQFLADSFQDDPEAAKLAQMAQMGVPGAEQALTERLNPKKEALGAFLQHLQSGVADPAMIAEIAPRYGLKPETASLAAQTAQARMAQKQQEAMAAEKEMIDYRARTQAAYKPRATGSGGAGPASKGGVSFEDFMNMTPERREAYQKYMGDDGRGSTTGGLTPGQLQIRDRAVLELDKTIQQADTQLAKYENMRGKLEEAFGGSQKVAEVLTGYADTPLIGPLAGAAGAALTNEANTMLKDYVNSEVLRRMAGLGGNDSNEELRRMTASLPNAAMNPQVALNLADALDRYTAINRVVQQLYREDVVKYGAAVPVEDRQYYKQAEAMLMKSGQIGPPVELGGGQGKRNVQSPEQLQQPQERAPAMQPQPAPGGFTTPSGIKIRIKQ